MILIFQRKQMSSSSPPYLKRHTMSEENENNATMCPENDSVWKSDSWYLYALSHMFLPLLTFFLFSTSIPALVRIALVVALAALWEVVEAVSVNTIGNYGIFRDIDDKTKADAEDVTNIGFDIWFAMFGSFTGALLVDGMGIEPWNMFGAGKPWKEVGAFLLLLVGYYVAHSVGSGYSRMCNTTRNVDGECDKCTGEPFVHPTGIYWMGLALFGFLSLGVLFFGFPLSHIPVFMIIYSLFAGACSLLLYSNIVHVQVLTAILAAIAGLGSILRRNRKVKFGSSGKNAPWVNVPGLKAPLVRWWV